MRGLDAPALLEAAQAGDNDACERLLLGNSGRIWSVARRYYGRGVDPEDLYQLGCLGFLKAVRGFDTGYGTQFSTYAVPKIAGEIRRFLRDDGAVKVGRSIREQAQTLYAARERLRHQLGREPALSELSEATGLETEDIVMALDANVEVESIYKTVGSGEDQNLCLLDKLPDEREMQEELLNSMVLGQLLKQLNEKDREIIIKRYFDNQTQSQIAAELNISQVQVSRLEKRILRQMRECLSR